MIKLSRDARIELRKITTAIATIVAVAFAFQTILGYLKKSMDNANKAIIYEANINKDFRDLIQSAQAKFQSLPERQRLQETANLSKILMGTSELLELTRKKLEQVKKHIESGGVIRVGPIIQTLDDMHIDPALTNGAKVARYKMQEALNLIITAKGEVEVMRKKYGLDVNRFNKQIAELEVFLFEQLKASK